MSIKDNIKKILFIGMWCAVAAGSLALLVAAIGMRKSRICRDYEVSFINSDFPGVMNRAEILSILMAGKQGKLTGKSIVSYDLQGMEAALKKNPWIKDAQLFFDNKELLHIRITLRTPIARVFTKTGSSYFIDSEAAAMPMRDYGKIDLPVFTNFPIQRTRLHGPDSALSDQTRKLALFLLQDSFWKAEIQQIAVTDSRSFDMVPLIGSHIIEFGDANNYQDKFSRLQLFYNEVLDKVGFDAYSRIDLRFENQIVATRRGTNMSRADSLQAVRNIRLLIEAQKRQQADTLALPATKPLEQNTVTEQTLTNLDIVTGSDDSIPVTRGKKAQKQKR